MGVFSEKGDCDMMGKSKGSVKGVLTCYVQQWFARPLWDETSISSQVILLMYWVKLFRSK